MSGNDNMRGLTAGDVLTPDALVAEDGLVPFASRKTVIRWAREGTIPSRKRAGKVYFIRSEVEEWLLGDARGEAA